MTLSVSNKPRKVADMSLMECQCFFSIFHLKSSNCVRFCGGKISSWALRYSQLPWYLGVYPSSRAPPLQNMLRRPCSKARNSNTVDHSIVQVTDKSVMSNGFLSTSFKSNHSSVSLILPVLLNCPLWRHYVLLIPDKGKCIRLRHCLECIV